MSRTLQLLTIMIVLAAGLACASESPRQDEQLLRDAYQRNLGGLADNSFGLPLVLESVAQDDRVYVDAYGIFTFDFDTIAEVLQVPANWCDILSLTLNVKACTYQGEPDARQLTLYLGRKIYQTPREAYEVVYHVSRVESRKSYLDIVLLADAGPFGTRDHQFRLEAMPLDSGETFVHVRCSYRSGAMLRLVEKIYFGTLGSGKVGFTVIGTDRSGTPIYIGGPRGAIERNAVRNYLAIQAFMSTLPAPPAERFSMRTSIWYDLTDRYRLQLFELDKSDYLRNKSKERKNQEQLQHEIDAAPP